GDCPPGRTATRSCVARRPPPKCTPSSPTPSASASPVGSSVSPFSAAAGSRTQARPVNAAACSFGYGVFLSTAKTPAREGLKVRRGGGQSHHDERWDWFTFHTQG